MSKEPVPLEVEAKLLGSGPAVLRAIGRLERIGPYPLRRQPAERLHTTYLDTADLALARHGVALRLRRKGRRWEATVKWSGRVDGDVHERPELTVDLGRAPKMPFVPPPGPLHAQLAALLCGRPLAPILITEIHRRLFDVLPEAAPVEPGAVPEALGAEALGPELPGAGAPVAELALDHVRLRTPDGDRPDDVYDEVEIECRHGTRDDVARLAELLRRDFELRASMQTKLARGLAAFHGRVAFGDGDHPVLPADTVREGARHVVARHLGRLRCNDPGTRAGTDAEALHDMRVAVRRLRAAARLLAAGIPARLQRSMRAELKWLGQTLGGVRDLDVQLAKLAAASAAAPAGFRPRFEGFRAYLEAERVRRRADLLAALDGERYYALLLSLERFARSRSRPRAGEAGAREPFATAGRRALEKAFRRLRACGEKIDTLPHPEDLHALRIRAKRLRYLLEFLADLGGKPARRLVRRLTRLQDLLGGYHDAVVAADCVRIFVDEAGSRGAGRAAPGSSLTPAELVALSAIVAGELRRAEDLRSVFENAWRRFARRRTVADCRAVRRKLRKLERRCAPPAAAAVENPPPVTADALAEPATSPEPPAPVAQAPAATEEST